MCRDQQHTESTGLTFTMSTVILTCINMKTRRALNTPRGNLQQYDLAFTKEIEWRTPTKYGL